MRAPSQARPAPFDITHILAVLLIFRRNRTFVVAWLTPLLVALAALALPASGMAAGTGNITGTVFKEGGGTLPGVKVCPWALEGPEEELPCATSGVAGFYELAALPENEYLIEFRPTGLNYVWEFYDNTREFETATGVKVTGGETKSDIDAELEKGATISGVVTSAATGQPAPKVEVCAFAIDVSSYGCTETNAVGSYTIIGLAGGQYELEFYPEGNGQGLLWQTYSLGLVTLAPHEEAKNVNQALQSGGQILGVVRLAATGSPLAGVRICVTEASSVEVSTCLTSPASGGYRFYGLPPGSYKVAFSPAPGEVRDKSPIADAYPTQWWQGAGSFATATPIAITPSAIVNGVDGALGPPPVVTAPVVPPAPVKKKVPRKPKPLKCRHGFIKRKVHGKAKCVRRHKAAKHKRHHKK
jgi:carboxypeptidase family protein